MIESAVDPTPVTAGAEVSVQSLGRRFLAKSGATVEALRDLSLELGRGEFVTVVGPSGCGKSTLLLTIAGLQHPTSGRVLIEGQEVVKPTPIIGLAFQRDNLLEWRTVLNNVLVQADLRGWKKGSREVRARQLLEMVGLSDFERSYPRELSGGMRQRVALCRAVLHEPRILLLDEPFGAVDAMTREQLNIDVGHLCSQAGLTAFLVTHDINEAAFMSDRIVVMTARPGTVAGIVPVSAPTPRDPSFRATPEFLAATVAVREILESTRAPARA